MKLILKKNWNHDNTLANSLYLGQVNVVTLPTHNINIPVYCISVY